MFSIILFRADMFDTQVFMLFLFVLTLRPTHIYDLTTVLLISVLVLLIFPFRSRTKSARRLYNVHPMIHLPSAPKPKTPRTETRSSIPQCSMRQLPGQTTQYAPCQEMNRKAFETAPEKIILAQRIMSRLINPL